MAHTQTPWRNQGWVPTWAYIPIHDASHNLVASMYPDSGHNYTREQVEANAAFIVRAVNAHDDLVKAARRALVTLKATGESVRPGNVLGALEAALSQAEGETI